MSGFWINLNKGNCITRSIKMILGDPNEWYTHQERLEDDEYRRLWDEYLDDQELIEDS